MPPNPFYRGCLAALPLALLAWLALAALVAALLF